MEGNCISELKDYVEIVCKNRYRNIRSDDRDRQITINSSKIIDNFLSNRRNERRAYNYLRNNYEIIYNYGFRNEIKTSAGRVKWSKPTYFYRGVSSSTHRIAPGIYRENEQHEENYYFNEISVRCPEAFRSFGNLEKLTYMQHYGCPTRLLDITSNPLVALYFACLGDEKEDGSVYIFAVDREEVRYANSNHIQMLSKLAEFKKDEQERLRLLAYYHLFKKGKIRQQNDKTDVEISLVKRFPQDSQGKYVDPLLERYYHAIKRNNGAFEREIVPFDLLRPQFVQPNKDNPRILKQDGAFIVSGLDADDRESDMKIRKYLVAEVAIAGKNKGELREQLERVGINQATLFPEVEKVADYLRKRP